MTTLAELVTKVTTLCKRPDQTVLAAQFIKDAVMALHISDPQNASVYYPRDIVEVAGTITGQHPNVATPLPPRFRKLEYCRAFKTSEILPGDKLTLTAPGQIYDALRQVRDNLCYIANNKFNAYISDTAVDRLLIGYTAFPVITDIGIESDWIFVEYESAVKYLAASYLHARLGNNEDARLHMNLAAPHMTSLWSNELFPGGIQSDFVAE